jgi:hypothetical protein
MDAFLWFATGLTLTLLAFAFATALTIDWS